MELKPTQRFSKDHRLQDAASFTRVFDKASRSRDNWFTVLCRNNDLELARLGLAISKKNCKQAAGRNRIKRVVRESFRQHQVGLHGLDIVVMNRPPAAVATNQELFSSLDMHWRRCKKTQTARK